MPKWMGSTPSLHGDREQDRRHDQGDRRRFHDVAGEQQQDVHREQKQNHAQVLIDHPCRHRLRDVLVRQQEGEQDGVGDDVEQHGAHVGGVEQDFRYALERHVLVDEHGDDEGVDRAHRRRLGRRERARIDAADDDDDQQQPPHAVPEGPQHGGKTRPRHAGIVVLPRAIPGDDAEHRRQHDAGDDAGDEQLADGGIGRHRVHDHDDRRRDQNAERAGGGDDAGAEPLGEPRPDHRRQKDRADRHHGRRARPGDGREQRARQDAGDAETAVQVADAGAWRS